MKVLIIGGNRFVGYLLAWRLLARGDHVTLFNRGSLPDPFDAWRFGDRVERLHGDRTTGDFARLLHGRSFDAVVDFAAFHGPDARGAKELFSGDRTGHYVMISTGSVYLVREDCPWPAKESDYAGPLIPEPTDEIQHGQWEYGMGKRAAEDVLDEAWHTNRFPATRLRLPMVNGARDYARRLESYLWRILDGGPVLVPDGGPQPCRHVYGPCVADAILKLLGNPETFGQAYNLCQQEEPSLGELVSLLTRIAGAPSRMVSISSTDLQAAGLDSREISPFSTPAMSWLDPSCAERELAFQHEPLESYLEKIVTCYFAAPPAAPPPGYSHRPRELEIGS